MNRAQRRKMAKENKESTQTIEGQLSLFEKLPDHCLTCNKHFDKRNKSATMTWNVVVRNDQEQVNLYCPDCWKKAKLFIKELQEKQ